MHMHMHMHMSLVTGHRTVSNIKGFNTTISTIFWGWAPRRTGAQYARTFIERDFS